jgi:hypothetical protein
MRSVARAKQLFVAGGKRPRRVPFGIFCGLRLNLDLHHETQIYLGLWEHETHDLIRMAARRCSWVIDVGAGKGELCIYFLKRSLVESVLACEPNEYETDLFKANLLLNGYSDTDRIGIFNKLVGTASGAG